VSDKNGQGHTREDQGDEHLDGGDAHQVEAVGEEPEEAGDG
jgi:hypothetical protein